MFHDSSWGRPCILRACVRQVASLLIPGLVVVLLGACADRRESLARQHLQEQITSRSGGALTLSTFSKMNGYEQDVGGMKLYTLEWEARLLVNNDVWKAGDAFVGYWSDFSVMAAPPGTLDRLLVGGVKRFNKGSMVVLRGESKLQKADRGWRVLTARVTAAQAVDSGAASVPVVAAAATAPRADENATSRAGISAPDAHHPRATSQEFRGAWFEVWSPPNFSVIPSLRSATSSDGYDSAFFRSPDHRVEFYVYSPQWNGEPTDIALHASTEREVASESKTSEANVVKWFTISANDGSYTRTYQDTRSRDGSIRWVVGVKYADQAAYDAYKADYVRFKKSLKQFAD